jgi:membrane protein involved in colicin uptake
MIKLIWNKIVDSKVIQAAIVIVVMYIFLFACVIIGAIFEKNGL